MKEFFSIFKNSLTRKCMALLMSLLVVGAASAQTRVTGTVTDESGHPLMGVTVIVVGTNTGAITNLRVSIPSLLNLATHWSFSI